MKESEYIYKRLKFLFDEVKLLYNYIEKQQSSIEDLAKVIELMQTPEYIRKQAQTAQYIDATDKIKMVKDTMNEKKE